MITRRDALAGSAAAALSSASVARAEVQPDGLRGALDGSLEGLTPGSSEDQGPLLAQALGKAEAQGYPLFLPPGRYEIADVDLPRHAHLIGVPGRTWLAFRGGGYMLRARGASLIRLEGIGLDGSGLPIAGAEGLLAAESVDRLSVTDCEIAASAAAGLALKDCAGRVERSRIVAAGTVGIVTLQSRGMAVLDNVVSECGDTGILVIRDEEGADDTIVRGNRVSGIRADSGGTGQFGNAINVAQANGVIVADNRIDRCAFSAVRCFSSDNVQVTGNVASALGECAIYVEFAFEGAVVSNNLIDDAAFGISFANFLEYGGRLGVCSGNMIRNIRGGPRYADGNPQIGAGIGAEADTAITGNVIENARQGMQLGWGPYLRDVAATGNVIRNCPVGIGVTVVEEAGSALIANNLISQAERGAILGMRWEEVASEDLIAGAGSFSHLTIEGNRAG